MKKLYTNNDLDRIRIIDTYIRGDYTRKMAAMNLGITERQVTRIVRKYQDEGPESVIHKDTGKKTNKKYGDEFCQQIVDLYKNKYGEGKVCLNFCHFLDKLKEDEKIDIPYTSLRRILNNNGIQAPEARPLKKIHPPRPRRLFAGELLQVDASIHRWLYGDFRNYALHGAIDDATGIITGLWLEPSETMWGYRMVLYQTIKEYGIPKCFYTDNRTIFESPKKKTRPASLKSPYFKSLLTRLGIDIITTSNPRAKGRIERIWRTLQSRLFNELHLRKITTTEEANAFIKDYLLVLNKAFASSIVPGKNLFKEVPADYDYNHNLAIRKEVKVYGNCYLSYMGHYFVVRENNKPVNLDRINTVQLCTLLDDNLAVYCNNKWYDVFDIGPKSLHSDLYAKEQAEKARKSDNSPWRQFNTSFINRDRAKWDDKNLRSKC